MSDIENKIAEIRRQADQARQLQARAAAAREQAQGALTATEKALEDEFGVTTPEESQALMAELEREQEAEAERVSALLEQAGGGS
jgi:hypothetical protein